MNTKINFGMAMLFLAVTSCSSDELEMVNQGPEITFNTSVSRATETTLSNLEEFYVYGHAEGYETLFIDGLTASKGNTSGYYTLSETKYWPNEIKNIEFWAISGAPKENISINTNGQQIEDFAPKSYTIEDNNSGKDHTDLIVAYTKAQSPNVQLTFHHALSQISVKASTGTTTATAAESNGDENHIVKIKGAWLMNIAGKATVSCDSEDKDDNGYMIWGPGSTPSLYGYEFNEPTTLNHTFRGLLDKDDANSNLMLIPQKLNKWNLSADGTSSNGGAYILLLCRVELKHEGEKHSTGGSDDAVLSEGGYHYHQLFPYSTTYDQYAYGYTCVPLYNQDEQAPEWLKGKKYTYRLNICGKSSGAGIYPPFEELRGRVPEGKRGSYTYILGTNGAPDKNAGDPVLTKPIDFTVTIDEWKEGDTWNPMIP